MPLDIALAYDPVNRRTDAVFNGKDFALDTTWASRVLMSLGCERRAHPDDTVPSDTVNPPANAPLMNARGGSPCDILDPRGELTGSRGWVFSRSKLDEAVRRELQSSDAEALEWSDRLGVQMTLTVERIGQNTVAHRVQVGGQKITIPQVVGS